MLKSKVDSWTAPEPFAPGRPFRRAVKTETMTSYPLQDTATGAPRTERELDLEAIDDYPMLARCLSVWRAAQGGGGLPASLDVEGLDQAVLDYTMLLDYLPDTRDAKVRMVGSYIRQRATFQADGMRLRAFFEPRDAAIIAATLGRIADNRMPSLARRSHVPIAGERLSYVRLILPLSADGGSVTGFFKTIEPASLSADV